MTTIAVIPARGGSKRVPGKNIRPFAGRPMLHWPLAAARATGLFEALYVSTDDAAIAAVAQAGGARVPRFRDAGLADDHTPLRPVIRDAIAMAEADLGAPVTRVCMILATAALLTPALIRAGAALLDEPGVDFSFSAQAFPAPVQRALVRDAGGGVAMLWPEHRLTRSQDLPETFHDAGQVYWGRRDAFLSEAPMYGLSSRMLLLPPLTAVDIDTPDDWATAEALFRLRRGDMQES
jgi:pseudaminic acid cytidylyltransferase